MRPNPVREKLRRGECCFGIMAFEFFTPGLPQVLAAVGAEYVIFDMEHSGCGLDTIKEQVAFARSAGIVPVVRVSGHEYHLVAPVLDAGAMGIMVPGVETAEQAEGIASWCRYRPDGRRGLAFGIAHDDYACGDIVETMRRANDRTLVIALIEAEAGIANVEAIMAVPGIDVGWLGHYDLTDSLGIPGQFDHPRFLAAVDRLLAACRSQGKAAGFMDGNLDFVEAMMTKGFRAIGYGTDISLLQLAYRAGIERLRGKP